MSKQQKSKELQGYNSKPVLPICSNCKHFKSDKTTVKNRYGSYTDEKNIKCSLGGFAVKKQGSCNEFVVLESKGE